MKNELKNNTFTCIDDNGNNIECRVLFTFDLKENNKNYIVYTDDTKDENGQLRTYASTYTPGVEETELGAITTEEEWKMIEGILSSLAQKKEGLEE